MRRLLSDATDWARKIKRDVVALWIAARDKRTPLLAKIIAGTVAAYALSPVDLIPDFIPVLGYLDDIVIVPLGIMAAIRLIPPDLMDAFRSAARQRSDRPVSRTGQFAIVAIWIVASGAFVIGVWPTLDVLN